MSLKINSILTEQNIIDLLPTDKDIYWIRDEGHINTNKWSKVLETRCKKIINFSATNKIGYGIVCNFTETMMLRTVNQEIGDIPDALDKLVEIKKAHKGVKNYNPCAIFKVTNNETEEEKKNREKSLSLLKKAYILCNADLEDALATGRGTVGNIFLGKNNYGYVDKVEVNTTEKVIFCGENDMQD